MRSAVKDASDKQKAIQRIFDTAKTAGVIRPTKTLALADDVTISGWGTLDEAFKKLAKGKVVQQTAEVHAFVVENSAGLKKYGYETKSFIFDPSYAPGAYFKSHAEKQAFVSALQLLEVDIDTAKKKAIAIVTSRPT